MPREAIEVILGPMISEKVSSPRDGKKKVAFRVAADATKPEIRRAVRELYGKEKKIEVGKVRTVMMKGKVKRLGRMLVRRPDVKKAIVSLKGEGTLELFEAN